MVARTAGGREVGAEGYSDREVSSPNTLDIQCPAYGFGGRENAHYLFNGSLELERSVDLRRGRFMGLTHSGQPAETRNGFIEHDAEIVLTDEWLRDNDISVSTANLLTVGYIGHKLQLFAHDATNAFIIYGRSIGYADRHTQPAADSEELEQLLGRLDKEDPGEIIRELFGGMAVLAALHEDITAQFETIEALFARNRRLLADERSETWRLKRQLQKLQGSQRGAEQSDSGDDWFKRLFGEQAKGRGISVEAACSVLGLSPQVLDIDPVLAVNMASAARRAWSKTLHPDVADEKGRKAAEAKLKLINDAADIIEAKYKR